MRYLLLYEQCLKKHQDTIEFVRKYLEKTAPKNPQEYHPWSLPEYRMNHTLLVLRNSLLLSINRKVNLEVVALSAILHDVATYSSAREKHAEEGANIAKKYLRDQKCSQDTIEQVAHAIRVHAGPLVFSPRSTEAKILQDADTIDKVGALSLTTFLLHYGSRRLMQKQALEELQKDIPKRLEWYYRTMNFPEGKRIVGEGCKFIRVFIKKLQKEI